MKWIFHFIPYLIVGIAFANMKQLPMWGVFVVMVGMDIYSFITASLWD